MSARKEEVFILLWDGRYCGGRAEKAGNYLWKWGLPRKCLGPHEVYWSPCTKKSECSLAHLRGHLRPPLHMTCLPKPTLPESPWLLGFWVPLRSRRKQGNKWSPPALKEMSGTGLRVLETRTQDKALRSHRRETSSAEFLWSRIQILRGKLGLIRPVCSLVSRLCAGLPSPDDCGLSPGPAGHSPAADSSPLHPNGPWAWCGQVQAGSAGWRYAHSSG